MSEAARQRVLPLLQAMPTAGLAAAKQLFCTELNYDRANERLSTRGWPAPVQETLAGREPPLLLAQHTSQFGDFHVIYTRLAAEQRGRAFPLSLAAERQVVTQLLPDHPYALFLFSDPEAHHWHLVNVRYDQEAARRRIYRRIAVGPHERLRTAAERVAMLDVAALPRDLLGLAPIAIQQRHDEAFDVEAVTRAFFGEYRAIFQTTEARIRGLRGDARRLFTQKLFNRLMFIVFLERKGWLTFQGQGDYLRALWEDYQQERQRTPDISFYRDRLRLLFFSGLNTPNEVNIVGIRRDGVLQTRIGDVPYLNGGLFEEDDTDRDSRIVVPDEVLERALDRLFYHFNFTVTESTPLDIEVAVDPEMLGKIFEELVTGRHETGSYYTPKPVVAFMGREALKGHLLANCPRESPAAVAAFVDERDPGALRNPETVLEALRTVMVCDPACGSGAYLLGMLHELLDLRAGLFATRGLDALTTYQRKLEIIQHNLYGVDLDPFAVNIARLRLWLSLIVDFDGDNPPPLPNLDFKIEAGDSLTGPDPSGGIQPDLFRQRQVEEFFRVKADFLLAHGGEKVELRKQIERLRQEIASWAHPKDGGGGFDWAVEFAEVFTPAAGSGRKGGFDIVLANPPYVRADAQHKHICNFTHTFAGTARLCFQCSIRAPGSARPNRLAFPPQLSQHGMPHGDGIRVPHKSGLAQKWRDPVGAGINTLGRELVSRGPDLRAQLVPFFLSLGFAVGQVPGRYLAAQLPEVEVQLGMAVFQSPRDFAHWGRRLFVARQDRFQRTPQARGVPGAAQSFGGRHGRGPHRGLAGAALQDLVCRQ